MAKERVTTPQVLPLGGPGAGAGTAAVIIENAFPIAATANGKKIRQTDRQMLWQMVRQRSGKWKKIIGTDLAANGVKAYKNRGTKLIP